MGKAQETSSWGEGNSNNKIREIERERDQQSQQNNTKLAAWISTLGYESGLMGRIAVSPGCPYNSEARCDPVVWKAKKIIAIELLVSWEDGCDKAHEWKHAR